MYGRQKKDAENMEERIKTESEKQTNINYVEVKVNDGTIDSNLI